MLVYAAAAAGLTTLIKPLIDGVLPHQLAPLSFWGVRDGLRAWSLAVMAIYLAKGLGAYFSSYLMTDIGQRVVRDIRESAVPPHPRPVGRLLPQAAPPAR